MASRRWLTQELAKPFEGKTVVITHHGPHPLSVHPLYVGDKRNGAYVSDLSALMPNVDLWLHGHVHDSLTIRWADAASWPTLRGTYATGLRRFPGRTFCSRTKHLARNW
ncbi:3',5'-cyclic adenosine monophosphate phosphodiesterase CpdA (plasmid) [Comamonadaceae bacterium OS-4]|nr:3',5'-cyclic adenosine monophosphate phosphodiesterase CpdA [Comamonadaceae bacterium OS-4]